MLNNSPIPQALQDLAAGKMIILMDDKNRENEGDLVIAAEHVTPAAINFMIKHTCGIICLSMLEADFKRLNIPMMVEKNNARHQTPFGVSIEAKEGVTTGVSAFDRAHTIQTAINEHNDHTSIVMPGHMFPLCAKAGGVLERNGHTEGSVDLARLAGLKPAAVICEIMNDDGTMARLDDLTVFAKTHALSIVSIRELQEYRIQHEALIQLTAEAALPTERHGAFNIQIFTSMLDKTEKEYVVLSKPSRDKHAPPLVRLHSACLTGDIFGSARCDCGEQLERSMALIAQSGGVIIYLPQEGRGIGLANKIKAYALQEQGFDTVEANHKLGFADDLRDYSLAAQILQRLNITSIRLLTNNPRKVAGLERCGIHVSQRIPIETPSHENNVCYLQTKRDKLGHFMNLKEQP